MYNFLNQLLLDVLHGVGFSAIAYFTCWLFFSKKLKRLEANSLTLSQKEYLLLFVDKNEYLIRCMTARIDLLEKNIMDLRIHIDDTQEKQSIKDRLLVLETLEKKDK
jgi:hypothetical protein